MKLTFPYIWIALLVFAPQSVNAQSGVKAPTDEQKAIAKLDFLIGNWAGQGLSFTQDGVESPYYDTEDVTYDVNQSIIVIRANGYKNDINTYSLHTIIHYDSDKKHYWYQPFTAKGARQYRCELVEKKFLCMNQSNDFRLTFQRLDNGQWNEFGEKRNDNGLWIKTFETKLDAAEK